MGIASKAGLGSIAALMLLGTTSVDAQRVVRHGPGASYPAPVMVRPAAPVHGARWEGRAGRWRGGLDAPGGYAAYRRPYRGWALPAYWVSPRFYVTDWASYDLAPPPGGYRWTRYYDDAVLIDARGSVYDSRGGIDWDRDDDGYAGNLAYDEGRGPARRGEDYPPPPVGGVYGGAARWVSPDGATTVTTTSAGYGGGTTVVTVQSAPVVTTTTTTETVEDAVTYTPRRTYRTHRKYVARRPSKYLRR